SSCRRIAPSSRDCSTASPSIWKPQPRRKQRPSSFDPGVRSKSVNRRSLLVLLHAALFFGALSAVATIAAFWPGLIQARLWIGLPVGVLVIALVTWNASILSQTQSFEIALGAGAFVATALLRVTMQRWSWMGAQLYAAATLASIAYLLYAGSITYVVARDAVYLVASGLLLVLELAALGLSLSYLFEIVDTISRTSDRPHPSDPNYLPKVAVQIPAYNEPDRTLASIAYLLYAGSITYVVARDAVYLVASGLLLVLELAALGLSLSYLFEIVDTISRTSDRPHPSDPNYLPKVAVQIPAYNEPLEVVGETL